MRVCAGPAWGPFTAGESSEALTHFDRQAHVLEYEATDGLPWFVRSAKNRWSVDAHGPEECIVKSHAQLDVALYLRPLLSFLGIFLRGPMNKLLNELAAEVLKRKP